MWTFLVTEVLFFGGLFTAYVYYRSIFPQGFAEGSHHNDVLLGAINTAVLICSSFTMAIGVHGAEGGNRRQVILALLGTILIGLVFLFIKGYEYYVHYQDHLVPGLNFHYPGELSGQVHIFMTFYFVMTGMHALHMIIGICIMMLLIPLMWWGKLKLSNPNAIEMTGLYWHFVDIIWIFLFPLFYLIERG